MSVCEIVQTGPSHRLPRGSDEVTVRCTECGGSWTTSERNRRRIVAGESPGTCRNCKRPKLTVTETHRRYWLLLFGADLGDLTAAEYVREHGLPPELQLICADLGDAVLEIAA